MSDLKIPDIFSIKVLDMLEASRAHVLAHLPPLPRTSVISCSLYTSIGGEDALKDVIDHFVKSLGDNIVLGMYFKSVNTVRYQLVNLVISKFLTYLSSQS